MKKIYLMILLMLSCFPAWAEVSLEPLINKVSFQLNGEQWVNTKTALADVRVNAAVTDQGIENMQASIMQKLSQLSSKAEWHILSFDRQLDKSGLESVQVIAQARLDQSELSHLRSTAKSFSKAGETYTIDSVQFIPSDEEIKQANMALRNSIYLQAKAEIDQLNKVYPDQKYYLYRIDFYPPATPIAAMAVQENVGMRAFQSPAAAPSTPPVTVSNKVALQANVIAGALPQQALSAFAH